MYSTITEKGVGCNQKHSVHEADEEDGNGSSIDGASVWKDSEGRESESESASFNNKTFLRRVDPLPKLTTRQSLITMMLHQNDGAASLKSNPALQRSRTASPNGPSLAASLDSDDDSLLMIKKTNLKPFTEIPRSGLPQPIIQTTTTNGHNQQLALSPKTTRRNMLATELTVSLRQGLLWERQQKYQTANAVLKRRHTTHDIANLKQYPDKIYMGKEEDRDETMTSWNQNFSDSLSENCYW